MKLYLKDQEIALRSPRIMGVLAVQPQESVLIDDLVNKAQEMQDSGADLIEIGIQSLTCIDAKEELNKLIPVVKAVSEKTSLIVAIATIYPEVMEEAVNVGAQLIIDHNALRSVGAIETVAKLKVPVCLVFDQDIDFESSSASDPMSEVSSFLYERIDACLNAGIDRRKLLIDPSLSPEDPIESKLKMIGRLDTFKSFALPMTIAIPRSIPSADSFLNDHFPAAVAAAIFSIQSGINIIRTARVEEMALAIDTWQAASKSARPFKLTKAIASRFKRKLKE